MSQETIRILSGGAIFWAEIMPDASGGIRAIAGAPPATQVTLSPPLPSGVKAVSDSRGLVFQPTVFTTQAGTLSYAGLAADQAAPPVIGEASPPALSAIAGTVSSLDGRFHPRLFSVTPTPKAPVYLPLRPSLQGTSIGEAGAVLINLVWSGAGAASWSVVNLTGTRNGQSLGFTGQADVNGDVIVPLTGLPPLPPAQTSDSLTLSVLGDPTQSGLSAGNPDKLAAVQISTGGAFAATQTLSIKRGQITTAATLGFTGFTLQAA
jgi:hypothetical protein